MDAKMSPEEHLITDWSREARAALVEARGAEVRLLLDLAFADFVDEAAAPLSAFGFRGDDPVAEAVEWCVERFTTGEIDPERLHAGSRSFRLFTEVRFWLFQKVGRQGYRAIMGRHRQVSLSAKDRPQQEPEPQVEVARTDAPLLEEHVLRRLVLTSRTLQRRTCADLVGYWLDGTSRIRSEWFGWDERASVGEDLTPKQRSFHVADALFRYLVLFLGILGSLPPGPPVEVLSKGLFTRCENRRPYRVDDSRLVRDIGLKSTREVSRLRKEGLRLAILTCAQTAALPLPETDAPVDVLLARHSLRGSLLHHYKLEDGDLKVRIKSVETA